MPVDKLAIGRGEVKQLLLLMDTDNDGKELANSKVRVSHFASVGK